MALFSYPVCTWLCQYVNMGVRKWLEKSAEKQKYKLRKTLNPLSRKAFRAVSFSATKDRWTLHEHLLFQRRLCRQGVAVMSKQKLRVKVLMCLDPRFFIFCTLVRPFIKPLRISNMMSCSQDTLSDFPISCNLAGNRVLAHGTMHLVHCFKKHDSIK